MSPKEKVMKIEERSEATPTATTATAPVGLQAPTEEPPVTFTKWFKVRGKERGFKPHWVAGLQAFADTNVPRPMSEWDRIFKAY